MIKKQNKNKCQYFRYGYLITGSQLAKVKNYIPYMSVP